MPTWGWFVVALVLLDAAVLAAWFLARKSPRTKSSMASTNRGIPAPAPSSDAHGSDIRAWDDIVPKLRSLKAEGRAITAIELLRTRSGLSLREAKETVDRL